MDNEWKIRYVFGIFICLRTALNVYSKALKQGPLLITRIQQVEKCHQMFDIFTLL